MKKLLGLFLVLATGTSAYKLQGHSEFEDSCGNGGFVPKELERQLYEEEAGSGVTREVLEKADVNATITGSVLDSTGKLVLAATLADATYILIDDLTRPSAAEYANVQVLARGGQAPMAQQELDRAHARPA